MRSELLPFGLIIWLASWLGSSAVSIINQEVMRRCERLLLIHRLPLLLDELRAASVQAFIVLIPVGVTIPGRAGLCLLGHMHSINSSCH